MDYKGKSALTAFGVAALTMLPRIILASAFLIFSMAMFRSAGGGK